MATRRRSSRPLSRRQMRSLSRPARVQGLSVTDAGIAVGTTRLTDIGALLATALGQETAGVLITNVIARGNLIGTVGGFQTYTYALFIGSGLLDVADVLPDSNPASQSWWYRRQLVHRGTQHNVTSAVSEFDTRQLTINTRGARRLPRGETLWLAEETFGQTQNVGWRIDVSLNLG